MRTTLLVRRAANPRLEPPRTVTVQRASGWRPTLKQECEPVAGSLRLCGDSTSLPTRSRGGLLAPDEGPTQVSGMGVHA
jgi:hypothetical protein